MWDPFSYLAIKDCKNKLLTKTNGRKSYFALFVSLLYLFLFSFFLFDEKKELALNYFNALLLKRKMEILPSLQSATSFYLSPSLAVLLLLQILLAPHNSTLLPLHCALLFLVIKCIPINHHTHARARTHTRT